MIPGDAEIVMAVKQNGVVRFEEVFHVKYPSGEPLVRYIPDGQVMGIMLRQKSMDAFLALMCWVDAYQDRTGNQKIKLLIPNFPGGRQDRLNEDGDYLFTARSFTEMVNLRRFSQVILVDPHSDVTPALLARCDVMRPAFSFRDNGYAGVISPDAGAEKRARIMADRIGVPLYHAWKTRELNSGALTGFGCQELAGGKRYLVADDLCDAGGTFLGLHKEIKKYGAQADLYVTHGLFTKGTNTLVSTFGKVITTDSTVGEKPGVQVISLCSTIFQELFK